MHGLLELFRQRSFLSARLSRVAMAYWILKGNVFLLFKYQLLQHLGKKNNPEALHQLLLGTASPAHMQLYSFGCSRYVC